MLSNTHALAAISKRITEKGYEPILLEDDLFLEPKDLIPKLIARARPNSVVIAAGETRMLIPKNISPGTGGRNTHTALVAMGYVAQNQCFTSIASDGIDNSRAAGAIADSETKQRGLENKIDMQTATNRFDSYEFFKETGDLIQTGPTESNVSDFYILITK